MEHQQVHHHYVLWIPKPIRMWIISVICLIAGFILLYRGFELAIEFGMIKSYQQQSTQPSSLHISEQ